MKVFYIISILLLYSQANFGQQQNRFSDISASAGLDGEQSNEGIAVGDFNNDGYDDFYVSNPGGINQLYKNNKDGSFQEMGEQMDVSLDPDVDSRTAVWGDINNDGWLDLYVGNRATPDRLFLNNQGRGFAEISFDAGIYQEGHPKSVNLADINNDGWLDIYISNFGAENVCYLNNQDKTFINYTFVAKALDKGKAMGTVFFDYDKDGDVDIYLVHDSFEPNFLYQNDGQGIFTEVGEVAGVATRSFGMGVDVADINNDGWLDIYLTNLGKNILLLNNTDGTFSNISESAEIEDFGMGWGINFLDYDHDGLEDIYVANDFSFSPTPYPNVLYRNTGELVFVKAEQNSDVCNQENTYGTAILDYDLNGQQDILVANRGEANHLQLFSNSGSAVNNWLSLKLIGSVSNKSAIGAKISIKDNLGVLHFAEVKAGSSWSSQSTLLQNIGLGQATALDEIIIYWPSGLEQKIDCEINKFYTVFESGRVDDGIVSESTISATTQPAFDDQFLVFPNPANGEFHIAFTSNDNEPIVVNVFNSIGQLIYNKTITEVDRGENQITLNNLHSLTKSGSQSLVIQIINRNFMYYKKILYIK